MITFEQTLVDKTLRQRYLEEVDFGRFSAYDFSVHYADNGHPLADMSTVIDIKTKKIMIKVYKNIYEDTLFTGFEGNFLSTLVDHEGLHVEQYATLVNNNTLSLLSDPMVIIKNEILAIQNQISTAITGSRFVTPHYMKILSSLLCSQTRLSILHSQGISSYPRIIAW